MINITKEQLSSLKVLIVDDMPNNSFLLKSILKKEGYQLDIANNGYEAIDKVAQWSPDIVLLDVMMPGIDGFQVAEIIKGNPDSEDIAIIFITALSDSGQIIKGFESGGDDYITKPINSKEIAIRVKHQAIIAISRNKILKQHEELERNIKWRDKLYSVVAHDLRDPLGSVQMLLTMALNEHKVDESQSYEFLQMASDAANKTFSLLDNLLKWTKTQIGNTEVVTKKFSIESVVDQNIDLLKPTCINKKITIEFDAKSKESFVLADYDMINTVIRNLLSNAIKFSHSDSKIEVDVTNDEKFSTVSIKDYGIGISNKYTHLILNDNSGHSTLGTNSESGHGLGLLSCKYFVEVNGGNISFESEEGKGTKFSIIIPICKENAK